MKVKCYYCRHKWNFKGNPKAKIITCPNSTCHRTLSFAKVKRLMK